MAVHGGRRAGGRFPSTDLRRKGFSPTTSIGRYLVSEGISVRREGAPRTSDTVDMATEHDDAAARESAVFAGGVR